MGNAESPQEAVAFAIARGSLLAETYVVWDHDLNMTTITHEQAIGDLRGPKEGSTDPGQENNA